MIEDKLTKGFWFSEDVTPSDLKKGAIIGTTTADFDYCSFYCSFQKTVWNAVIEVVWVDDDYSQFDPEKGATGGEYGFNYYKIIKVIDNNYSDFLSSEEEEYKRMEEEIIELELDINEEDIDEEL